MEFKLLKEHGIFQQFTLTFESDGDLIEIGLIKNTNLATIRVWIIINREVVIQQEFSPEFLVFLVHKYIEMAKKEIG